MAHHITGRFDQIETSVLILTQYPVDFFLTELSYNSVNAMNTLHLKHLWLWIALGAIVFTIIFFAYYGRGEYSVAGALVSVGDDSQIAVRGQLYKGTDLSVPSHRYVDTLVAKVSDSADISRTIIDGSAARVSEGYYFFREDTPSVTSASSVDQLRSDWIERSTSTEPDFGALIGVTVTLQRSWFVFWKGVEIHYSYPSSNI